MAYTKEHKRKKKPRFKKKPVQRKCQTTLDQPKS